MAKWVSLLLFLVVVRCSTYALATRQIVDCAQRKDDELSCLACNVYHEARGEPLLGQLAIALVTRNRVRAPEYPPTYCAVVWQKSLVRRSDRTFYVAQFSWTLDGLGDGVVDPIAWGKRLAVAHVVMADVLVSDITRGALWYHANYVMPYWADELAKRIVIGNHIFYVR